eukprot:5017954-Amphidinium_carterae.1
MEKREADGVAGLPQAHAFPFPPGRPSWRQRHSGKRQLCCNIDWNELVLSCYFGTARSTVAT